MAKCSESYEKIILGYEVNKGENGKQIEVVPSRKGCPTEEGIQKISS
jgi:hypothetical protein